MRIGFMMKCDPERIAFAQKHGFGCVELIVDVDTPYLPGKDGWKDKALAVKKGFDAAGLRISCIGGFYKNHMDADAAEARRQFDMVRNAIALAAHIGVPVVAGFSGRIMDKDPVESVACFKKIWSEHARVAEEHRIRIAFEHCPMGKFHSPFGGNNAICTPDMWDRCFDAVPSDTLGLEWDPSHLICMFVDPIENLRRYGKKVYHVHAKDARANWDVIRRYGLYHPHAMEHCFVGLGDTDWPAVVKELLRAGYAGDLNIEGWHDQVFHDFEDGPKREDQGLLISKAHLAPYLDGR